MKYFIVLAASFLVSGAHADLIVYSDRPADRFTEAVNDFKAQTGETVQFVEGPYADLVKKIEADGANSPADMIITKDLVYLGDLTQKGLLKGFQPSESITKVPAFMRASGNEWVALTYRARTLIYNPTLVSKEELSTYKDLADPKWEQGLCLRTGKAAYNEALVAGLIAKYGKGEAKGIVQGWLNNISLAPLANDNAVIAEVAKGTNCQVGIVNHYYLAIAKDADSNLPVEIAFLDQNEEGVFTNGTAAGLIKTSAKAELAQVFMDLLLTEKSQLSISSAHFDYPAVEGVVPTTLIKDWGGFKMNPISWESLGGLISDSRALISEVGYE